MNIFTHFFQVSVSQLTKLIEKLLLFKSSNDPMVNTSYSFGKIYDQKPKSEFFKMTFMTTTFRNIAFALAILFGSFTNSFAGQPDLELTNNITEGGYTFMPLNNIFKFQVKVENKNIDKATGVVVTDMLPSGLRYVSSRVVYGGGSYVPNTGVWNIGQINGNDYALLEVEVQVIQRGITIHRASITSQNEPDDNSFLSSPVLASTEDFKDAFCVSVPYYYYDGDEYEVSIDPMYTDAVWKRNEFTVIAPNGTPGASIVNGKLKITSVGDYTLYSAKRNNCPTSGCCPIRVIPGPFGSIGDYVFKDKNNNGIQDAGDEPYAGVRVELYDAQGSLLKETQTTGADGKYLFTKLTKTGYKVKFYTPNGEEFTTKGQGSDDKNSDVDASSGGFTEVIPIDIEKAAGSKERDNLDVDAGFKVKYGSIGDVVWKDLNSNNKQDAGEPGIPNLQVDLLNEIGGFISSTTTDFAGNYKFENLSSGKYKVKFYSNGETFVVAKDGSNIQIDSDAGAGGVSDVIEIDVTKEPSNILRNNLTIDAGLKPKCEIATGSLVGSLASVCLPVNNSVQLTASVGTIATIPGGYSIKYLLTKGSESVIFEIGNSPSFSVLTIGDYRIHALVFDPDVNSSNYFNLSSIVLGTTKISDIKTTLDDKCSALDLSGASFSVYNKPILTQATGGTFCEGSVATISAISTDNTINWYRTPTGGTLYQTSNSGENLTIAGLTAETNFYAEASKDGCFSDRSLATVYITPKPQKPIVNSLANICPADFVDLDPTIEWHDQNNTNNSSLITNLKIKAITTVFAVNKTATSGCFSDIQVVPVVIKDCPCLTPASATVQELSPLCAGLNPISVKLNGNYNLNVSTATWTSSGTGTFDNNLSKTPTYSVSQQDISNGSVLFTYTTNDPDGSGKCISDIKTVTLVLNKIPEKPTDLNGEPKICLGETNKLFATSQQGFPVVWYDSPTGGVLLGDANIAGIPVLPNAVGTYKYYAETKSPIGECVSDQRAVFSFVVEKCYTDLTIEKTIPNGQTNYFKGQEVTYQLKARNLGPYKAQSVKVQDLLPPGLTYISHTGGAYDAISGTWSVGELQYNNVPAVLILTARCDLTGTLLNKSSISSPDEDTLKLGNNKSEIAINVATQKIDLSLKIEANKYNTQLNEEVEYTITITNEGPGTANNVQIRNILPEGLEFVRGGLQENGRTLTSGLITLTPNSSNIFKFVAKVTKDGIVTNMAEVFKADEEDIDSSPNNATSGIDEDDDDKVDINTILPCDNFANPILTVDNEFVCPGKEAVVRASGCPAGSTFTWSNGKTGIGTSDVLRENITSSRQYSFTCTKGECSSAEAAVVKIYPIPKLVIEPTPRVVCQGGTTTLKSSGCEAGTILWGSGETTLQVDNVKPTVIGDAGNIYTAVCTVNGCPSAEQKAKVLVNPIPNAPIISSDKDTVCEDNLVNVFAKNCEGGIIKWEDGREGESFGIRPTYTTDPFRAKCVIKNCESPWSDPKVIYVEDVKPPVLDVNPKFICKSGTATLTATGCKGSIIWSANTNYTGGASQITVTKNRTEVFTAKCQTKYCTSDDSEPIVLTVSDPSPPIVSATDNNYTVCTGGSKELTATGCERGEILWEDGTKGIPYMVKPIGQTSYSAKCIENNCTSGSSSYVRISINDFTKPSISASPRNICIGDNVTLSAFSCAGTPIWFADAVKIGEGTTLVQKPNASVTYSATCESATCKSGKSEELNVTVTDGGTGPIISANKTKVCSKEVVQLSATACQNGTIKWSNGATTSVVNLSLDQTTTFSARCITNGCDSRPSNEITVEVTPGSGVINFKVNTDKLSVCQGASAVLTATGCPTTVTWGDGTTGETKTITPTISDNYSATCAASECGLAASSSVKVDVLQSSTKPRIIIADKVFCGGTQVTLYSRNCGGSVVWSPGGSTTTDIIVSPKETTTYTVTCKNSTCGTDQVSDPFEIKLGVPNTPVISSNVTTVCGGGNPVTFTAKGCDATVKWSNGAEGETITETVTKDVTFSAFCTTQFCPSPKSNEIKIKVIAPSVPSISSSSTAICDGTTVDIYGSCSVGSIVWSNGQTSPTLTVTSNELANTVAKCQLSGCESVESKKPNVIIGKPTAPIISSNISKICFGSYAVLTSKNCVGTTIWNDGQNGNEIVTRSNLSSSTAYTATCLVGNCESESSNTIPITVDGKGLKMPVTENVANICPERTVSLSKALKSTANTPGGVFEYHIDVLPTSPLVAFPNSVETTGVYYVFEKATGGCYSQAGIINAFISPDCSRPDCKQQPATVNAGVDASICADKTFKMNSTYGGAASNAQWKTTGSGKFNNSFLKDAVYTASLADIKKGSVKLYFVTNDPDGAGTCVAAADTMELSIKGIDFKPKVSKSGQLSICGSDSVVLSGSEGPYTYQWFKVGDRNPISSSKAISVKGDIGGDYFFKIYNSEGCSSLESDTVTVRPVSSSSTPLTVRDATINLSETIDLFSLVTDRPLTNIEFHIDNSPLSPTILDPTTAGPGTYYAFRRGSGGCFNTGAKIVVKTNGIVSSSDLVIDISRSPIDPDTKLSTVTITVKNNGVDDSRNVDITSRLTGSVTLVQTMSPELIKNADGTVLSANIPLIKNGETKTYTYTVLITGNTGINETKVLSKSTSDPNTGNNTKYISFSDQLIKSDVSVSISSNKENTNLKIGDLVTYTVVVRNNGPSTSEAISVSNPLPSGIAYKQADSNPSLKLVNGVLSTNIDSLKNGETRTYIYTGVVTKTGVIENTVTVAKIDDINPTNNTSTAIINSENKTDLMITSSYSDVNKTNNTVLVTVTVKNIGTDVAKDVNISSVLDQSQYVANVPVGMSYVGNQISKKLAELPPGETHTVVYTVQLSQDGKTLLSTVSTSTPETDLGNNKSNISPSVNSVVASETDLSVSIVSNKTEAYKDEEVIYTVTVRNNGPNPANNVVVKNKIPLGVEFVNSPNLTRINDSLTATIASLPVGQTATFTYVVKKRGVENVTNEVRIINPNDVSQNNNSDAVLVKGIPEKTADVSIATEKSEPDANGISTIKVTVVNNGPDDSRGVLVTNVLDKNIILVANPDVFEQSNNTLFKTIPTMANGETKIFTYKVKLVPDQSSGIISTQVTTQVKDAITSNNNSVVEIVPIGTPPTKKPDIAIEIDADKTEAKVGEVVNYTIRVRNNGPNDATNVNISSLVPPGLGEITFTSTPSLVLNNNTLTANIDKLSPNNEVIYTFTGKMLSTNPVTVSVKAVSEGDIITLNNENSVTVKGVLPSVNSDVEITSSQSATRPDGTATVTVKVTNKGPNNAENVSVRSVLDPVLNVVGSPVGLTANGNTLSTTLTTLGNGETKEFTYVVKITGQTPGDIVSNVSSITQDNQTLNNQSKVTILVPNTPNSLKPDVAVKITADKSSATIDERIVYTVTVRNVGPIDANNVLVENFIPAGAVFETTIGSPPLTRVLDKLTANIATLKKDEEVVYRYSVKKNTTSVITSTANVTVKDDINPANNTSTVNVGNPPSSDLEVKTVASAPNANGISNITITIKNNGPDVAQNVSLTNSVTGTLTDITSSNLTVNGSTLIANESSLASGATKTYTFSVKVTGETGQVVSNVTSNTPDLILTNNNSIVNVGVPPTNKADLSVTLNSNKESASPGETVIYTLTVTNVGPEDAKNVAIKNILPPELTNFKIISGPTSLAINGNILTTTVPTVEKDKTLTYVFSVVKEGEKQAISVASVTSATTNDPNTINNSDDHVLGAVSTPSADLVITSKEGIRNADGTETITVTVKNNGPAQAKDVSIVSAISGSLSIVSKDPEWVQSGNTLTTKTLPVMNSGDEVTYTYVVKINGNTGVINSEVKSTVYDKNLDNNKSTLNPGSPKAPDVSSSITSDKSIAEIDEIITMKVLVRNNGTQDATNVNVRSFLPPGVVFVESIGTRKLEKQGDSLRNTLPILKIGEEVEYVFTVKKTTDNNVAIPSIASTKGDKDGSNDKSSVLIKAKPLPVANVSIKTELSKVDNDGKSTLTMTITNLGPDLAKGIDITSLLSGGSTIPVLPPGWVRVGNTIKYTESSLSLNETKTFVFDVVFTGKNADGKYPVGTFISSEVKSTTKDDDLSDNVSKVAPPAGTIVGGGEPADVNVNIKADKSTSGQEELIVYTITVINVGPTTARNIDVKSILSNSLTLVGSTTLTVNNNELTGKIDSLELGKTYVYTFTAKKKDNVDVTTTVTVNTNPADKDLTKNTHSVEVKKKDSIVPVDKLSIGLAKEVVKDELKQDPFNENIWTITYKIYVTNYGKDKANNLQIEDDLKQVFTDKGVVIIGKPVLTSLSSTLQVNGNYTGQGVNIKMLNDASSSLASGETGIITMAVKVNTSNQKGDNVYNNVAVGSIKDTDIKDISTEGSNPDPNGDMKPDEMIPTMIALDKSQPKDYMIGLAKKADTLRQSDGSYNVTYSLVAINYGKVPLSSISLTDTLSNVFGDDARYTVTVPPTITRGDLTANILFDGNVKKNVYLVNADASKAPLAPGDSIKLFFVVNLKEIARKGAFLNTAVVKAIADNNNKDLVGDLSTDGVTPDPNRDGNPSEKSPTPVLFKSYTDELIIPEGFSPNGDGVNDKFVIKNIDFSKNGIQLMIYNRWGALVYAEEDYRNQWQGEANQGIGINFAGGLPDGTYYYSIQQFKRTANPLKTEYLGGRIIRFMTIAK
ncbi:MAG: DUF11 domain-containing protein [Pseudarcicella sp.]|nr:DUF11 domain-containing protein [Pseudarcicella sp.]